MDRLTVFAGPAISCVSSASALASDLELLAGRLLVIIMMIIDLTTLQGQLAGRDHDNGIHAQSAPYHELKHSPAALRSVTFPVWSLCDTTYESRAQVEV